MKAVYNQAIIKQLEDEAMSSVIYTGHISNPITRCVRGRIISIVFNKEGLQSNDEVLFINHHSRPIDNRMRGGELYRVVDIKNILARVESGDR